MINDNTVEKAVKFLADTDESHAKLKAEVNSLKDLRKVVWSYEMIDAEGTGEVRKAKAYAARSYTDHITLTKNKEAEFVELNNRRERAFRTIDLWRSFNANRNKGNV